MRETTATTDQVHRFRLRAHHLDRPAPRTELVAVVRDTGGIQSQVPSAAELSIRARVRGLRRHDVRRALEEERTLVRGWMVRFAVHVIPADDFLLYTRALIARVERTYRWMHLHGKDAKKFEAILASIGRALSRGPLTRRALAERVVADLGEQVRKSIEHSWGGLLVEACVRGSACFGPDRGNDVTFVSRTKWLPDVQDYSPEDAGQILLKRYLRAFGPASKHDFQAWAYIPMPDVNRIWERAAPDLVEVRAGGGSGWIHKEHLRELRASVRGPTSVRLLPSFDTYLLGHRDKGHLVDRAHYKRVYRKAGWLTPVVLINGRIAGVWSHRRARGRWEIHVEPFGRLEHEAREGIDSEADDIGRFLGGASELSYTKPRAGQS